MRTRVLVLILAGACGRIGFDDVGADGDGGAGGSITWVQTFVSHAVLSGSSTTDTFTGSALHAGDAIIVHVFCQDATPTAVAIDAPGWSFMQLGSLVEQSSSGYNATSFGAVAPDTTPQTFSVVWTASVPCGFFDEIGDELAGVDPAGGVTTFDSHAEIAASGDCHVDITTHHANDAVWTACSGNAVTAVGAGYIKSADDGYGDWSAYKLTTEPAGTLETTSFTGTMSFVITSVTIKPR